jgi:phage baseplate assembly protein W
MPTYSFKSSGKSVINTSSTSRTIAPTPIGIKTPLRLGEKTGILDMHVSLLDQISDNLRNLLLTNNGERVAFYDFGGNLRRLTTEFETQEDFDSAAMDSIKQAVARWMPYVDLVDFSSETNHIENKNTAIREITITYNVPSINVENRKLLIRLYVI